MDAIEAVIRGIFVQADFDVIMKRLVRNEYINLIGTDTLSADEDKAIDTTMGKIIAEIAQKMQLEPHSNEVTNDKKVQKDNTNADNVITLGYQNEEMTQSVCTRNEDSEKDTKMSHFQTKVVNGTESTERSFVLAHSVCNNSALEPSQFCSMSSSKCKLMKSSEASICVLESDDTRSDNSSSESFDSSQIKTAGYWLLKKSNISSSPDRKSNQRWEKQNDTRYDILNTGERLSSEIAITPDKQYKTQGLVLSNAYLVNNDDNRSTNSIQNPGSHRNVHNVLKELYSKSGVSYTPESSCSRELYSESGVSYTPESSCSKSSSLDFLTMTSQKCRQDCVIDSSSDNCDVHFVDVNLVNYLSDQEKCNVNRKRKINCVIESSSDSESCFSVAKRKQRCRLDGSAHKKVVKRDLLPIVEGLSSSSSELSADVLFGCEVTSTQHRDDNLDSDTFVPVESSKCHESNDSSSPFSKMIRRARLKVRERKRNFADSDSDFQLSGSLQKNTSYKPMCNRKHSNVMIKIVDRCSSNVEVIKNGVISDLEILERLEYKGKRTFYSQIRKERKSFSGSMRFKAKKQPLKMLKSNTCNVYNCDLDNSCESVTRSQSLKHAQCSQSLKHSQNLNQTSKPTKSVYDFNNDEFDVPLSTLNSCQNYASGRNVSASYGRGVEKCSVVISAEEKVICDRARNNSCSASSYQLDSKSQDCLLNCSSIVESSQKILFKLRQTTKYTQNDSADSSCDSKSRSSSHDSYLDEQVSPSEVHTPQINDSDNSLPRLSHISPVCNPQSTTTHCITKKSCMNIQLDEHKMICGMLRDKMERMRQLLKGGMPDVELQYQTSTPC